MRADHTAEKPVLRDTLAKGNLPWLLDSELEMNMRITDQLQEPMLAEGYPPGTERITYVSAHDGAQDWAQFLPGNVRKKTAVYLHGSFASADQIFRRQDIRDFWLTRIMGGCHPLLSVNMRGTS